MLHGKYFSRLTKSCNHLVISLGRDCMNEGLRHLADHDSDWRKKVLIQHEINNILRETIELNVAEGFSPNVINECTDLK